MKILLLNFAKGWRGGERQTLLLAQGFSKYALNPELLCRSDNPLQKKAEQMGITTHAFGGLFGVLYFLITKAGKYDVLHAQTSQILTYCVLTRPFHGRPIVYTRRVNFAQKGVFTKLKYRFTQKLVTISGPAKETLQCFTNRADISVISSIVETENTGAENAAATIVELRQGHKLVIGITAALTYEKLPLQNVEAMQLLKEKNPNFICLHFGSGAMQQQVQEKINALGMQEHYKLMGFWPNVISLFPHFDIFVMNSLNEGLGSSVLDAYLYGIPVVSTNAGGLADIVKPEMAIVCSAGEPACIANGVLELMEDENLRGELTRVAKDYVLKNHSMSFICRQYAELFKKITGKNI